MSIRNQLRAAIDILSCTTGPMLAKQVREVMTSFNDPELQNEPVFPTAYGRWLTVAEVKEYFGPNWATDRTVIEQCISAYTGRLTRAAIEEVGLDIYSLSPGQLGRILTATTKAEESAFVLMTAN